LSVEKIYEQMSLKLNQIVPEIELRYKAELVYEINRLKVEKKCINFGPQLYGAGAVPFCSGLAAATLSPMEHSVSNRYLFAAVFSTYFIIAVVLPE